MTTTPTWLPKEYIVSFSWMVTHPGIKVIQQGLTLAIGQEVVYPLLVQAVLIFKDLFQIEVLNKHLLLTSKPVIYLVNLSEKDYIRKKNKWSV